MTREEFLNTGWTGGIKVSMNSEEYEVAYCDFEDLTVGICVGDDVDEVPCEDVEIVR